MADATVRRYIQRRGHRRPEDRLRASIFGLGILLPVSCREFLLLQPPQLVELIFVSRIRLVTRDQGWWRRPACGVHGDTGRRPDVYPLTSQHVRSGLDAGSVR